ncbi:MAG TPA: TilS substrate-binding domain-containing protein, partial [Nocardioidaceae bacterium]
RADADVLDEIAGDLRTRAVEATGDGVDVAILAASPSAVRRRVLRRVALDAGSPATDLFALHVDELERLLVDWHGQGPIMLPGDVTATRHDGVIRFACTRGEA